LEDCMGESESFLVFKDSGCPVPHVDVWHVTWFIFDGLYLMHVELKSEKKKKGKMIWNMDG
jgi:hypothetical protein